MSRSPDLGGTVELASSEALVGEYESLQPVKKRRVRIGAAVSSTPIRVLAIGDCHDHPGLPDKSRAALLGHHAIQFGADWVIQLGDASDANSACHHVRNNTYGARFKPSFAQDLASFEQFWETLDAPLRGHKIRKHFCRGNHEQWWWTFEDEHPENHGLVTDRFNAIPADRGWTHTEFGEFFYVGGVGFTHVPLNIMGKPISDARTLARRWAMHDIVYGHTHYPADEWEQKAGLQQHVRVVNCGSAMPEGYIGDYASRTPNSYFYGCYELVIYDGHIQSVRCVTMRELEKLHGDKLPRRRRLAA